MSRLLVMPVVGSCVSTQPSPTCPARPIAISQPVGQGHRARNLRDDVKTVQEALNQVTVKGVAGGPMPFLAVDGIVGPKTLAAIFKFQQIQVRSIIPDGLVEPEKATILRLNEVVAPISKYDLNEKLATSLPIVQAGLAAAIENLTAALPGGAGTPGLATLARDRLKRHFRLNTLDASSQSKFTRVLRDTFSLMAHVVNRPEHFGMLGAVEAFDIDWTYGKRAQTYEKGAFGPPLVNGEDNPARHIQIGMGFFAPDVTPDFAAFILTHELAHFTGRGDGVIIGRDLGRGWFDERYIKPLSATQRLLNADSYATFAVECRTNSATKPAYVQTAPGGAAGNR